MPEETSKNQLDIVLVPIEQHTIMFYGKPLTVVRLPDGAPAVVFSHLCKNMGLERTAQLQRVQRNKALARGYHNVRLDTAGGPQVVSVLTLRVTPGWLFGIDANRAAPEVRTDIERYQDEAMDVLYQWAATSRIAPAGLVPDKPIVKPEIPAQGASPQEWLVYNRQMVEFLEWQISIEQWRGGIEERLESIEALIPDILERLPDATITPAHQNMVKYYVSQLNKATGKSPATIYSSLFTAFNVPRYTELQEAEWEPVEDWFLKQLGRKK